MQFSQVDCDSNNLVLLLRSSITLPVLCQAELPVLIGIDVYEELGTDVLQSLGWLSFSSQHFYFWL